jgi:YbgC/YbaW family acyl-CoA thioester hydrolase
METQPHESHGRTCIVQDRVRWADVDLVGIMRYSAFTRLIELGEQELCRDAGLPYSEIFQAPEVWLPRRMLTIEYLAPARIDDLLDVETFVSRMGETSLTYHVDIRSQAGTLVATASLVVVCVTAAEFRKIPMNREFRDALTPYLGSPEAVRAGRAMRAAHASHPG